MFPQRFPTNKNTPMKNKFIGFSHVSISAQLARFPSRLHLLPGGTVDSRNKNRNMSKTESTWRSAHCLSWQWINIVTVIPSAVAPGWTPGFWGKRENVPDCLQSRWTDVAEMLRDEGKTFIKWADFTKTDFLFPSRWSANVLLHLRLAPFHFNNSNYSPFIVKMGSFSESLENQQT